MASKRQIEANRNNCKRSTGPKTAAGKGRSSSNARRHGLSRPRLQGQTGVHAMANVLVANLEQPSANAVAEPLARAKVWLSEIRSARHEMLVALLISPTRKSLKRVVGLERYEKVARAEQRRLLKRLRQV